MEVRELKDIIKSIINNMADPCPVLARLKCPWDKEGKKCLDLNCALNPKDCYMKYLDS